jgi:heme exporter protein CcmD
MLGPHTAFILGAYGVAVAGVIALIIWVVFDYLAQRKALTVLEARRMKQK